MTLLLRASATEHVLRSVDDRPGVIGLGMFDGRHAFIIDTAFEPLKPGRPEALAAYAAAHPAGGSLVDMSQAHVPAPSDSRLSIEEAVDACEGELELATLLHTAASSIPAAQVYYGSRGMFEYVADACRFAIDVRDRVLPLLAAS